ncbi:MAG: cbb3-type cytochrome oxidase assembly protein CcoS [Bdellovibrionales bacterium]|nr:cbb3-type cytochrome oxidase assembly protein CcoS [Bdellovibrionales bacterium]
MDIIFILLPASLLLAIVALLAFLWSAKSGQFEDLDTPSRRMLFDDEQDVRSSRTNTKNSESIHK